MARPTSIKATDLAVLAESGRQVTKFARGMSGFIDWLYDQASEAYQKAGMATVGDHRREHWRQAGRAEAYTDMIMQLTGMTHHEVWVERINRQ